MLSNIPHLTIKLRNDIRELRRSAVREERHQYVAEGVNLARELLKSGIRPSSVVVRDDAQQDVLEMVERFAAAGVNVSVCSAKNMDLMTDAATPQAIVCVVPFHAERPLQDRILVLDAVSDPGNVGTMVRTAAWFGFTDVVLGMGCADVYHPKTMRSTAGAAMRINVIRHRKLVEWIDSLDARPRFAAVPRSGSSPQVLNDADSFALVIGSESHGISTELVEKCTMSVTIPGTKDVESLNAAAAAAILCYEGRRR